MKSLLTLATIMIFSSLAFAASDTDKTDTTEINKATEHLNRSAAELKALNDAHVNASQDNEKNVIQETLEQAQQAAKAQAAENARIANTPIQSLNSK